MSFFGSQKKQTKASPIQTLVNIATIVSTTITSLRLVLMGIISIKLATIIILGVVIFVAMGNNASKIILACAALILFVLLYSGGTREGFFALMQSLLTLIIVLIGFYVMLKGFFGGRK